MFSQGDAADSVFYIQSGSVKLSVVSSAGREAVIAMLTAKQFFGEGALAGEPMRLSTATAMGDTRLLVIDKHEMERLLHRHPTLSDRFIARRNGLGTSRSRVNIFMNKFKTLGFIDYNGTLKVHDSLLTVLLHGSSTTSD